MSNVENSIAALAKINPEDGLRKEAKPKGGDGQGAKDANGEWPEEVRNLFETTGHKMPREAAVIHG